MTLKVLLIVLGVLLLIFLFGSIPTFIWLPETLTRGLAFSSTKEYLDYLAATRQSLAMLFSSLVTVIAAIAAGATVFSGYQTYLLSNAKQASETYSTTAALLSSERIADRLAAIYGLERLARSSAMDYVQAYDVLCAYLRHAFPTTPQSLQSDTNQSGRCSDDIQAALFAIGQRFKKRKEGDSRHDLSNIRVQHAWLRKLDFSNCYFWKIEFFDVNLSECDLRQTDFKDAMLDACDFDRVKLKGANFLNANLICPINLSDANRALVERSGGTIVESQS
jgi:hypothetical protein